MGPTNKLVCHRDIKVMKYCIMPTISGVQPRVLPLCCCSV